MTAIIMDTLKFAMTLREAGMEENVANKLAEAIKETQEEALSDLATKQDIEILRSANKQDIALVLAKIELSQKEITIKLGTLIAVAVGLIAALIKF